MQFLAFPAKDDAILANMKNKNDIIMETSGNLGFFYSNQCHMTIPNSTLNDNREEEWCSNIVDRGSSDRPWITFRIKDKKMKIHGYALRNGCCYHSCCCDDSGAIIDYYCCCDLYTFSLQGSNDNKTWKTLHRVEKKRDFYHCKYEIYNFNAYEPFTYLRLYDEEPYPGCAFCMIINQIEFYGETVKSFNDYSYEDDQDLDESVSIIGKVKTE